MHERLTGTGNMMGELASPLFSKVRQSVMRCSRASRGSRSIGPLPCMNCEPIPKRWSAEAKMTKRLARHLQHCSTPAAGATGWSTLLCAGRGGMSRRRRRMRSGGHLQVVIELEMEASQLMQCTTSLQLHHIIPACNECQIYTASGSCSRR